MLTKKLIKKIIVSFSCLCFINSFVDGMEFDSLHELAECCSNDTITSAIIIIRNTTAQHVLAVIHQIRLLEKQNFQITQVDNLPMLIITGQPIIIHKMQQFIRNYLDVSHN